MKDVAIPPSPFFDYAPLIESLASLCRRKIKERLIPWEHHGLGDKRVDRFDLGVLESYYTVMICGPRRTGMSEAITDLLTTDDIAIVDSDQHRARLRYRLVHEDVLDVERANRIVHLADFHRVTRGLVDLQTILQSNNTPRVRRIYVNDASRLSPALDLQALAAWIDRMFSPEERPLLILVG